MDAYWRRILLGALAIFVVGYGLVRLGRFAAGKLRSTFESAGPIRIPLPFVPLLVDGVREGTLESLTLLRTAPRQVSGVEVRARLGDTVTMDRLRECRFTSRSATSFNPEAGLACLRPGAADSSLAVVGTVTLSQARGESVSLPLLLPPEVLAKLRPDLGDSARRADSANPAMPAGPAAGTTGVGGKAADTVSNRATLDSTQTPP